MRRLRLTVLFCSPSLASGVAAVLGAGLLLLIANLSYLLNSGLIYETIFGKGSPYDLVQTSHDTISLLTHTVLSNTLLNKVLFFAFWMMIGLFVYITVITFSQTVSQAGEEVHSLHYIHAHKQLIERNLLVRLALRLGGILAAIIYIWIFLSLLLPFSIFASRIGLAELNRVVGWLYILLSWLVLTLSLHIAVIIVRLISLKPRLFGGWDSLLETKNSSLRNDTAA